MLVKNKPMSFWRSFFFYAPIAALLYVPFMIVWTIIFTPSHGVFRFISEPILFGIGLGLVVANQVQVLIISIPFDNRDSAITRLRSHLEGRNYCLESETGDVIVYRYSRGLIRIDLQVDIEEHSLTIIGPRNHVLSIKKEIWR